MVDEIEVSRMRPMQKKAYLGMAACFDVRGASSQQIQQCVQSQDALLQSCSQIIQAEMNDFQGRLQRCSMAYVS